MYSAIDDARLLRNLTEIKDAFGMSRDKLHSLIRRHRIYVVNGCDGYGEHSITRREFEYLAKQAGIECSWFMPRRNFEFSDGYWG